MIQLTVSNARIWDRGDAPALAFMDLHNGGSQPVSVTRVSAAHAGTVDIREPGEPDNQPLVVPPGETLDLDFTAKYLALTHLTMDHPTGSTEQLELVLADGSTLP